MNRPDTETRIWLAVIALIVIAAWCGFPWQAFAQPFPVLP